MESHFKIVWFTYSLLFHLCTSALSDIQYEEIVEETLESMSEYLDELADMPNCSEEYDVAYSVSMHGNTWYK